MAELNDLEILSVQAKVVDNMSPALQKIVASCKKTGRSFEETLSLIDKRFAQFQKHLDAGNQKDQARLQQAAKLRKEYVDKVTKAHKEEQEAIKKSKKTFGDFIQDTAKVGKAFGAIWAGQHGLKKIYTYVEAIAKVNWQLRQLSVSSGIGIASLSAMGSAAKMYGGSEQSVAGEATKFNQTISMARRGHGLGYLQQAAMEFGVGIDLFGSYQDNFESWIKQGRGMSKEDQVAFAKTVGGSRWNEMVQRMQLSEAEDARRQAYAKAVSNYTNASGENRLEDVAAASSEFAKNTNELAMEWKAIKDQIAAALLPLINGCLNVVKSITQWLNKHPGLLNVIAGIVATIGAAIAAWGFLKALGTIGSIIKQLFVMLGVEKLITREKAKQAALNAVNSSTGGGGGGKGGVWSFLKGIFSRGAGAAGAGAATAGAGAATAGAAGAGAAGAGAAGAGAAGAGAAGAAGAGAAGTGALVGGAAIIGAAAVGWGIGRLLDNYALNFNFGSFAIGKKGWEKKAKADAFASNSVDLVRNLEFMHQWSKATKQPIEMREKQMRRFMNKAESNAAAVGKTIDWSWEASKMGVSAEYLMKVKNGVTSSSDNRQISVVQNFVDSKDKANDAKNGLDAVDKSNTTGARVNSRA